ncbi:hypothetical protein B1F69_10270 [Pseudomonas syringae]|nr:hypothetical protein AO072_15680 [Pseudomonas syringae ICMP 13102]KWS17213.1 hypothetical protein AL064_26175 [Pseudomonas syringae pv. syringae]PBP42031.1 hypothetical protein CCL11_16465 [Pseudomonas syringae]KWS18967.1 hypothetical protein AL062_24245 [Pseudomonas syringae pv. syringae]KWS25395.1 hypothetical protein AL061_18595 [Pseudomonas syringae pv. syringae]
MQQRQLSGDQWFGGRVNLSLTRLNALASRGSDEKDVDSVRTAGEVIALCHVEGALCRRTT